MSDVIDLYGNTIDDELTPPPVDPLDRNLWTCSGCAGRFPESISPDIVVLDDPRIKFCTDACAEYKGNQSAAETYRNAYAAYGYTSVEVTVDGRMPDARSPQDRERYAEALAAQAERETYEPSFIAVAAAPAIEVSSTT
jgi:hypothetical protein